MTEKANMRQQQREGKRLSGLEFHWDATQERHACKPILKLYIREGTAQVPPGGKTSTQHIPLRVKGRYPAFLSVSICRNMKFWFRYRFRIPFSGPGPKSLFLEKNF